MPFSNKPLLRDSGEEGTWVLEENLTYITNNNDVITVPKGFLTDLASIPSLFTGVFDINGKHRSAAILHDYLYTIQDRIRYDADKIFLEAMESSGVGFFTRWSMFSAVRLGGWVSWNNYEDERSVDVYGFLKSAGL